MTLGQTWLKAADDGDFSDKAKLGFRVVRENSGMHKGKAFAVPILATGTLVEKGYGAQFARIQLATPAS